MIKQDYKTGDKIVSIKPGIFNGLEGVVLSVDPEKRKSLTVICGANGTWSFSYDEVEPMNGEKPIKVDTKITQPEIDNKIEKLTVVKTKRGSYVKHSKADPKKEKRAYVRKKDQPVKEIKPKRAYNKKPK